MAKNQISTHKKTQYHATHCHHQNRQLLSVTRIASGPSARNSMAVCAIQAPTADQSHHLKSAKVKNPARAKGQYT